MITDLYVGKQRSCWISLQIVEWTYCTRDFPECSSIAVLILGGSSLLIEAVCLKHYDIRVETKPTLRVSDCLAQNPGWWHRKRLQRYVRKRTNYWCQYAVACHGHPLVKCSQNIPELPNSAHHQWSTPGVRLPMGLQTRSQLTSVKELCTSVDQTDEPHEMTTLHILTFSRTYIVPVSARERHTFSCNTSGAVSTRSLSPPSPPRHESFIEIQNQGFVVLEACLLTTDAKTPKTTVMRNPFRSSRTGSERPMMIYSPL